MVHSRRTPGGREGRIRAHHDDCQPGSQSAPSSRPGSSVLCSARCGAAGCSPHETAGGSRSPASAPPVSITPIETHVYAALKSGDISYSEFDEFVLHFGTQAGWPKASAMQMYGMMSMYKIAEESGEQRQASDFELWAEPTA